MSARNEVINGRMSAVTLMRFDNRWAWNDNECWVWQGHCTAEGYGVMRIGQKRMMAHRLKAAKEDTVPDLPVEPYTVIRATWRDDEGVRNLVRIQAPQGSMWQTLTSGLVEYWRDETLQSLVTGFEVLARPCGQMPGSVADKIRRETAKAVLDRVENLSPFTYEGIDELRKEFCGE